MNPPLTVDHWLIWETIEQSLLEKLYDTDLVLTSNGFLDDPDSLGITFTPKERIHNVCPHLKGRYAVLKPIDFASNTFEVYFDENMDEDGTMGLEGMYTANEASDAAQHIFVYLTTGEYPDAAHATPLQ